METKAQGSKADSDAAATAALGYLPKSEIQADAWLKKYSKYDG